jgi:hypothetical protein
MALLLSTVHHWLTSCMLDNLGSTSTIHMTINSQVFECVNVLHYYCELVHKGTTQMKILFNLCCADKADNIVKLEPRKEAVEVNTKTKTFIAKSNEFVQKTGCMLMVVIHGIRIKFLNFKIALAMKYVINRKFLAVHAK